MTPDLSLTRPILTLRVGITGARNLEPAHCPRLRFQLHTVIRAAQRIMHELADRDPDIAAAYQRSPATATPPLMRFLSPLARGSDRLAAKEALSLGYNLHVPMPFLQTEYEKDFETPEDLAEFRELLAKAGGDWLALDGEHGPEADRAYEAVGRYVARHCDLLLAVWDGKAGAGLGGTADIVRYTAATGTPIWWLHATEACPPVWISDVDDLRYPQVVTLPAEEQLRVYLEACIKPPSPKPPRGHSWVGASASLGRRRDSSPAAEYFAEQERKQRWVWSAYDKLLRWTSGFQTLSISSHPPEDAAARYWFDRHKPADARAVQYAARYRSAYVWVFFFGTFALAFGALSLLFSLLHPTMAWLRNLAALFAFGELATLLLILALIWLGLRREWHERFIEYRLLAELYRKQQALAPLGWTLPIVAVRGVVEADRAAWVAWLFAAEDRAAPFPRGDLADAARGASRSGVLEGLILEQHRYHTARGKIAEAAGRTLARLGEYLFAAVLACVVLKLLFADELMHEGLAVLFAVLATVLPGVSAAFVGIRAYAELQLLAEQSYHMAAELERARGRLERLDPWRALVSQDIGAEAALVATLMLQDLDGWARLFRVKVMEPG
jgi:hypothetical protein